jgi:hypothetical protein
MTESDERPTSSEDPEVPEADALEQRTPVVEDEDDEVPAEPDLEADPADVAEQSRSVDLTDDEYR